MKTFDNIPEEKEGAIHFRAQMKFDELIDCVFEFWTWDGIQANSLIFHEEDVAHLSDEELKKMIIESPIFKKDNPYWATISRNREKYTFVNFNFEEISYLSSKTSTTTFPKSSDL